MNFTVLQMKWLALFLVIAFLAAVHCESEAEQQAPAEDIQHDGEAPKPAADEDDEENEGEEEEEEGGDEDDDGGDGKKEKEKEKAEPASANAAAETAPAKTTKKPNWVPSNPNRYYGGPIDKKQKWCKCFIAWVYGKVYYSFKRFPLPKPTPYAKTPYFSYWPPRPDPQVWCSRRCSKYCTGEPSINSFHAVAVCNRRHLRAQAGEKLGVLFLSSA